MADFNVQQEATIDNYRSTHKLGFVVTDEYIAELIKKEMEQTGVVYSGFENLARSVAKSQIKQPKQSTNANVNIKTNSDVSVFGTQIVDNEFDLGFSSKNTTTYPEIQPTESQNKAINFLKDITSDAETTFKNREDEAGALSTVVNMWQEVFNKQYAKSTVKKELQTAKEDLRQIELASKGQIGYTDFLGNTHIRSFEDVFKQRRGVKFNEQAVADCTQKAEQFAAIKTSVEMINQTKQTLGYTTKGDVHSQMNPQEASSAIIKAFQLSGINSLNEMNKTLKDIEQKYKNHPDIQKYGGNFKFAKNKQGQYVIYRTAKNGYPAEATNEQLRVIAKEMGLRLDKALATALGVEYSENATAEEMANLTQQTFDKYQKEYEDSFAKAYGKKDVKALADAYVLKQQQGVANIEMGLNIASMALMVVPGGAVATSGWALKGALLAKHTATGAKVVKVLQLVDKAKTFVKGAQTLQKVSQAASPFIMANMTLRPTELLEQLTSKNGMSAEEWKAWGQGVLQNSVYMAAGMGASKLAETGAAMYKTKALVNTLKSAGKSTDEIIAMIKANPVKFPNEIVKSLSKVDTLAKTLQVSSEVALDIGSTVLVNKAMGNGDLLPQDVINSIAFAISGGVLQKQFAPLSTEAKVSFIEKALKEYGVTKVEAERILKTMDDISAGKVRAKDIKPLDDHHDTQMLDEVVVTANKGNNTQTTLGDRLTTANSIEDFVAVLDEIKAIPNGAEKELYKPILEVFSNMNKKEFKAYNKYLNDYLKWEKSNLVDMPKLWQYNQNNELFLSKTLSIENLKNLFEIADLVKQDIIPVSYAKKLYHKKVIGLKLSLPENLFSGNKKDFEKLCIVQGNVIKELDKIENMDFFCQQSFELLKKNMGLEDSGVELKLVSGDEGGYYDVVTNTVYVNKDWTGENVDIKVGHGNKSEIFGDIAHELTHARQWIEIIRNGWLEDIPEWKDNILSTAQGKWLIYYSEQIGANEASLKKSCIDLNNWINYAEPYKKDLWGNFVKDVNGNLVIAPKNSIEYNNYRNQTVEQEAFENGYTVINNYKKITVDNTPRKISVDDIKRLFKDNKIDTNNNWYKSVSEFLEGVRTDNYKIDLSPELTAQDYETMAMLINLKDGKYFDLWQTTNPEDEIPNIQKLAIFVRTMKLTHQTLEYSNFNPNQWDIVVQDITTKPQDMIIPVLKYKLDSTPINNAISDKSYLKNNDMKKIVEKIETYINLFETKEQISVYRGDRSFNMLRGCKFPNGEDIYDIIIQKTREFKEAYKNDNYNVAEVKRVEDLFTSSGSVVEIIQDRFLSTAMFEEPIQNFAECIKWNITIPPGTSGASIEGFNIERLAEAEFLVNKDSRLIITAAMYDPEKNIWIFDAVVNRPKLK